MERKIVFESEERKRFQDLFAATVRTFPVNPEFTDLTFTNGRIKEEDVGSIRAAANGSPGYDLGRYARMMLAQGIIPCSEMRINYDPTDDRFRSELELPSTEQRVYIPRESLDQVMLRGGKPQKVRVTTAGIGSAFEEMRREIFPLVAEDFYLTNGTIAIQTDHKRRKHEGAYSYLHLKYESFSFGNGVELHVATAHIGDLETKAKYTEVVDWFNKLAEPYAQEIKAFERAAEARSREEPHLCP